MLRRLIRSLTHLRSLAHRDEGSALMAVIGFLGVAAIIAILISTVTLNALGFTSATRAGVQAVAAAEAGIDYSVASLTGGSCSAEYAPSTNPEFSVQVSYSLQASGDTWVSGCPAGAAAQRIRLVSTGTATATGVAGNASGDSRTVEAVYLAPPTDTVIQATGAAIYSYSALTFNGSGTLQTVEAAVPRVYVKTGDVTCTGRSQITGNVIVADGNLNALQSCAIGGSAWSSDSMTITGGSTVGGNAVAGSDLAFTNGSITGDAWAGGLMTLGNGSFVRNATTQTLKVLGTKVSGSAWASGTADFTNAGSGIKIIGNLTTKQWIKPGWATIDEYVGGTATQIAAGPGPGPVAPPIPTVPDWVDYPFDPSGWPGFSVTTLSGDCNWEAIQPLADAFAGQPGIIDARACTSAVEPSDYRDLNLTGDLAIIGKSFALGGKGITSTGGSHRLWLITPDSVADHQPSCVSGLGNTVISGNFIVDSNVAAMIYTPCQIKETASGNWYGQMYSNTATLSGAAKLAYVPVGLPGVDLNNGTVTGGAGDDDASALGSRISIRDLANGGS